MTSEDIKHQFIIKASVPSLISLMVSVDVKHHVYLLTLRHRQGGGDSSVVRAPDS